MGKSKTNVQKNDIRRNRVILNFDMDDRTTDNGKRATDNSNHFVTRNSDF